MLWTVFTLAFYGYFKASELTSSLNWSDIMLQSDQVSITLSQSKTDPFRHGETIHILLLNYLHAPLG